MMKKTIGLLAALMITLSSTGAVSAGAAEVDFTGGDDSTYIQQISDSLQDAIESGNRSAQKKYSEEYAKANCDPGYLKFTARRKEREKEAGGGKAAAITAAEKNKRNELMEQTLDSSSTYVRYINDYITHKSCFDGLPKTFGIDVSQFQGEIDWKKVKADGIKFAIIRLGYRGYGDRGDLCIDPYYEYNLREAKANGIQVGIYFYTQAITDAEARAEAKFVLNTLGGAYLDMPIYYDIEAYPASYGARMDYAGLTREDRLSHCREFCKVIENGGYTAGVYSYTSYFNNQLDGPALGKEYPVWLADYSQETSYTGAFHMWQFSSEADVDGVYSDGLDINVFYGDNNMGGQGAEVTSLARPAGLSKNGNTLTWNKVPDASGYEVSLHNTDKGTYSAVGSTSGNSYSITAPSEDYPYSVRAYYNGSNGKIYSAYSDDFYMGSGRVTGLKASLNGTEIILSWNKDNESDSYQIFRSADNKSFTKIGETSGLSFTDCDADSSRSKYYYYIQGFKNGQESKKSATLTVYLSADKSAPPVFSGCDSSSIKVTWKEMTGVAGYQLLQCNPSTGKYVVKGDVKADADRTYTFTDLDAGTSYKLGVRAYVMNGTEKKFGEISDDLTAKTAPGKVTGLSSTPIESGVKLSWNKTSGAEHYVIYRVSGSSYKKLGTVSGTSVNIKISGTGKKKYCVAAAITQGGSEYTGEYSSTITADSTGIGTPKITSGTYSNGAITLSWTKAANASGYRLYKYDASSKTYKSIKTLNGADNTTYTVTNVSKGVTEQFKVKAFKRENNEVKWGSASAVFSVKTSDPLPAPENLYAVASVTAVQLKWDAVKDADLYNVYEVNGSAYTFLAETSGTTYTMKSGAGSGRSFAVSAVAKDGSSKTAGSYSAAATVVSAPGVPTLSTASKTSDSIKLDWTVPSGASGVRLYMYDAKKKTYVTVKTLASSKHACTIKNLSSGTQYKFKAKAYTKTSTGITWGKATAVYTVTTN